MNHAGSILLAMLSVLSPGFVRFFSWILPHLVLVPLGVLFVRKRLYREFPCFFLYIGYEITEFLFLYTLSLIPSVTDTQYRYAYYATLACSVVLRFAVIEEIFRDLLKEAQSVKAAVRWAMRMVQVFLLIAGVLLAIYAPGNESMSLVTGLSVTNRGLAMVQSGFLLFLFFLCTFLGLSWRRPVFGVALGLGIYASVDLAVFAMRTELNNNLWGPYLNLVSTTSYLISVSIWLAYVLLPERPPSAEGTVSEKELNLWNKEFQRLLR